MGKAKAGAGESGDRMRPTGGSSATGQAETTQRTIEEIQLARLGARLRAVGDNRDLVRALGDDPDKYASELAKQYSGLGEKLRQPPPIRAKSIPSRLATRLDALADIYGWWQSVLAPNATVGLIGAPSSADTGGTGIGAEIFQGSLAVDGRIWNAGSQEQWWINTWQYLVPLPQTPSAFSNPASLSYRFNISGGLAFYSQDVVSGSVHIYATVATTNDMVDRPIDFAQPVSSNFAVATTLPVPGVPPTLGGTAKVTGTIPLQPGGTPAIGIIIGLAISLVDGSIDILPGEDTGIDLAPPDARSWSDLGRIEYRRDPSYWVEAVSKIFEA
jgi:hypothetical protein